MEKLTRRKPTSINMVVPVLIVLCIALSLAAPEFLGVTNIMNTLRQISMLGIVACGATFVMVTGNMDISTGSQIGLTGVIAAFFLVRLGLPTPLAIVLTLAAGLLLGLLNGVFAACTNINPFIITLGTMQIFKGASYIISGGLPIAGLPASFKLLGQGYVSVIPVPVIVLVIVALISAVVLTRTSTGRHVYAMGGNAEATRLAGVNTKRLIAFVYAVNGLACALAGIVYAARVNSGIPGAGEDYTFDVITASVLGGVSLSGGKGNVLGTIGGVLVIGILANGLVLMDVSEFWQQVIKGAILLLAVYIDAMKNARAQKRIAQVH